MIFKEKNYLIRLELNGQVIHEISSDDIQSEITIGRGTKCNWQIPIEDRSASSSHAKIVKNGSKITIYDLQSRNGIYFKGAKISEKRVSVGDIYSIGDCKLTIDVANIKENNRINNEEFHRLEQLGGTKNGTIYKLTTDIIKIGSASSCDIVLSDSLVSSLHATLECHNDGTCWIKDMSSRNGTKVNKTSLSSENAETGRMLKDGDIISIAYLDFRYLDKQVIHIRSYIFLKLGAVIATLAIVIGGYFAVQTISPSAKSIRLEAEHYAAEGNFTQASDTLVSATTARGADVDAPQRLELMRKLESWEETFKKWNNVKVSLSKNADTGTLYEANASLGALLSSSNDNWKWNNSNAVIEMKNAQNTHSLLSELLIAEDRLLNSEEDMDYIHTLLRKLNKNINICEQSPLSFQQKTLLMAKNIAAEIKKILDEYKAIQKTMAKYNSIDKTNEVALKLENIRKKAKERIILRKKDNLVVSNVIIQLCTNLIEPINELKNSKRLLANNYNNIAMFDFDKFYEELPLPSAEQCMVSANLSIRRADIENENSKLKQIIVQLKNFERYFKHNDISPSQKSVMLDRLFLNSVWDNVLNFDCLNRKQPAYSEKEAHSNYDRILGVYTFFEYIRSIGEDFDTTIFEERFKPELFRSKEIFNTLEVFNMFSNPPRQSKFAESIKELRSINSGNNTFTRYISTGTNILNNKDKLIEKLYRIYESNKLNRKGIIAGAVSFYLSSSNNKLFTKEELADNINNSVKILRRNLTKIIEKNKNVSPEQILANEKHLLELGIPGDPFIKQAWADRF